MDEVRERVESFVNDHRGTFRSRRDDGRIRHCHGDLRAKNIFIRPEKILFFDAIEFNDEISCCDVAAEIAFLAMDLDFFLRGRLGLAFVRDYVDRSGDEQALELLDFYKCYRALVQVLVKVHLLADPDIAKTEKDAARNECGRYLDLALAYTPAMSTA